MAGIRAAWVPVNRSSRSSASIYKKGAIGAFL